MLLLLFFTNNFILSKNFNFISILFYNLYVVIQSFEVSFRFESAVHVSAHSLLPCFIIYFLILSSRLAVFEMWYMGFLEAWFDGGILPERIYFISMRHFGLLPTWHHFELNSQLAGWGNKQVVWIQAETCLRTEFW